MAKLQAWHVEQDWAVWAGFTDIAAVHHRSSFARNVTFLIPRKACNLAAALGRHAGQVHRLGKPNGSYGLTICADCKASGFPSQDRIMIIMIMMI